MKKNIAIIMGGYSSEVAISIKSGTVVHQHIDLEKYIPYQVHILRDRWVVLDNNDTEHPIDKNDFSTKIAGEKIKFDFSPIGPSSVKAASLEPTAKFAIKPSVFPSFCLKASTELKPLARFDGNAPE